jgi:N-acetylmuramic acid 6-phosphate etherase
MNDLVNLDGLTTEAADERFSHADEMPTLAFVTAMNDADTAVPQAVRAALPQIAAAIDAIAARMASGGRLIYVGAGTSGRMGILDASECTPTFGTPPGLVTAAIAGGHEAFASPREGAEDDEPAGRSAIEDLAIGPNDSVVGIASSGRTPFVLAALAQARSRGALTIGFACNAATPLVAAADMGIEVLVGPEVLAGSTRLKAGTAQKLVLNMISTATMVRLGKTYGNLMVDLRPTNAKLRARAAAIVSAIAHVNPESALRALQSSGFDVKSAVLVARFGLTPALAATHLASSDGRLRTAIESLAVGEARHARNGDSA